MVRINIDGKELKAFAGQTILDAARSNGIDIPTLCHDDRVKTFGACGICVVETENSPKLLRACSTAISDGMIIKTNTQRVINSRKTALELLLSDHKGDCKAPCSIKCPGNTDCQGYVGLIANGKIKEAAEIAMDVVPLPSSIGRVCPHPCQDGCRRKLVEEPINIAGLKAFSGDYIITHNIEIAVKPDTGKKVAIIGGGPAGLTAAYFLRREGHDATIFDAMPKMGGMLRYGIPEYRLPKRILDAEISRISSIGIKMLNDVKIGRDVSFEHIRKSFDAVIVSIGAWKSMVLGCPGEELDGVIGGIDFLRKAALNEFSSPIGKRVAIVGGGNTAMDACRTAVRLGASEVYNIYRRTRNEMPAEDIEITEAEEEGVIFKNLTNPIEIIGESGKACKIRLQKMELGEPDASGRRSPVPIKGAEETLAVDTVIIAIGQTADATGLDELTKTRRNTLVADEITFSTNIEGVFAIGDATNKGAGIAIEAIAEAKKAVCFINEYINGGNLCSADSFKYLVEDIKTEADFSDHPKAAQEKSKHLKPDERKRTFLEVTSVYSEEQAVREAKRCLECGCADYFECRLIKYANEYKVEPKKYGGDKSKGNIDQSNPFFVRNPNKCILCGLCVRVCDEVMGRTALGFAGRGFETAVMPELGLPVVHTDCISCGQCVALCPTGALTEVIPKIKNVPVAENTVGSTCSFCSVGCSNMITSNSGMLLRSLPGTDHGLLCAKGRFGTVYSHRHTSQAPLVKKNHSLEKSTYEEAFIMVDGKMRSISAQKGSGAIAVAVSDKYTNEEISAVKYYAKHVLKTDKIFSFNSIKSGLVEATGTDASTCTFEEMENTDCILLFSRDIMRTHTIAGISVKKAVQNGSKLIVINDGAPSQSDEWAMSKIATSSDLSLLKQMVKYLLKNKGDGLENLEALKSSVGFNPEAPDEGICYEIRAAMDVYLNSKKAVIVFNQGELTTDAARLIADLAILSGHIGKPRSGIIQLKQNCNSQGLADLGIDTNGRKYIRALSKKLIKGLIIFGEDVPDIDVSSVDFLAVADSFLTETAEKADVFIPMCDFTETLGTYTSADGTKRFVSNVFGHGNGNLTIINGLISASGNAKSFVSIDAYSRNIEVNSSKFKLAVPKKDAMYYERRNTNALYSGFTDYMELSGVFSKNS